MASQSPIPYNRHSTATQVATDLASSISGKVVLTTGVTPKGLGAQFVEAIAPHKPRLLILAGRNVAKIQATVDTIKNNPANQGVETRILVLDLSSQKQIRKAAEEVLAYPENIDVVVNSAGIMAGPFRKTEEGIEGQFGSNHIGHFLFTNLIMPKVLASPEPRIVNVTSNGHRLSGVRFDDWNFQDGKAYDQWLAYGQSKTANILFTKGLAQKLGEKGLRSYTLHPGLIWGTSLAPGLSEEDMAALMGHVKALGSGPGPSSEPKTLDEGAATHVVTAFDPRLEDFNGAYLADGNLSEHLQWTAKNPEDVEKLWKLSEQLVNQEFQY